MPSPSHPAPDAGPISDLVRTLRSGDHRRLLARTGSGWAVLNDRQPSALGCCAMLVPDPVVSSVNDLDESRRLAFMSDLLRLGDAILAATDAERINYLVLCNQAPQLHAHAIPRYADEEPRLRRLGPFEAYDFAAAPRLEERPPDLARIEAIRRSLQGCTG